MELFPAIDLKGGQVVRLTQGDYNRVEVYSSDPAEVARGFLAQGAKNLHIVDLDGAKDGKPVNFDAVRSIVAVGGLYTELGGGIRDEERIAGYLELGVGRVILGTVAVEKPDFTREMIRKYGKKIAVGIDARDGKIAVRGWLETTAVDAISYCGELAEAGLSTIIYTDIARDGAMMGTNLEVYRLLAEKVSCDIVASGGISSLEELKELAEMGTYGAILGKALYTGALDLKEALEIC